MTIVGLPRARARRPRSTSARRRSSSPASRTEVAPVPPAPRRRRARAVTLAFLAPRTRQAFLEGHVDRLRAARRGARPDPLRQPAGAVVARVLAGRDRIETDRFIALRSHYGFDSFFCEPGRAGCPREGRRRGRGGPLPPTPPGARARGWRASPSSTRCSRAADRTDERRHIDGRRETVGPGVRGRAAAPAAAARRALRRRAAAARRRVDRKARVCVRQRWYSVPARLAGPAARRSGSVPGTVEVARTTARSSPATSGARARAARPCCSTTISRSSRASRVPCRRRSRSPRPGERACSRAAHERVLEAGATEARRRRAARGRSSRCCCSTGACRSSRSTPRSTPSSGSGSADPALVAIEARRIADGRGHDRGHASTGPTGRGWSRPVPGARRL